MRGLFLIPLENGKTVHIRFCTWSLVRFCEKAGLTMQEMLNGLGGNLNYSHIIQLIRCASEYPYRDNLSEYPYTDNDVYDWIDELGGLNSQGFDNMIKALVESVTPPTAKKQEQADPNGL